MKSKSFFKLKLFAAFIVILMTAYVVLTVGAYVFFRKHNTIFRINYAPESIITNPAGTCALIEYNFHRASRSLGIDMYRLFLLAPGDAFYTVTKIQSGEIIRDSTTQIVPSITAHSLAKVAMGNDVFYWSKDGKVAAFPGGDGPFYEWTDIKECEGTTPTPEYANSTEYANVSCDADNKSQLCEMLREQL
jgi:hypothetical protein